MSSWNNRDVKLVRTVRASPTWKYKQSRSIKTNTGKARGVLTLTPGKISKHTSRNFLTKDQHEKKILLLDYYGWFYVAFRNEYLNRKKHNLYKTGHDSYRNAY